MNIFYLDRHPHTCAIQHCDKHFKMIVEYAQLMSTAHRVLDGEQKVIQHPETKRRKTIYELDGDFYKATHVNHPSNIWVRSNSLHYQWLFKMWEHLLQEYTDRRGRVHATSRLYSQLKKLPRNIESIAFSDPPPTMPDEYKDADAVISYQNFYVGDKARFAKWTNRRPPNWFIKRTPNYDETHFTRTKSLAI